MTKPLTAMDRIEAAKTKIDSARSDIEAALVDVLRDATMEVAAEYPGLLVTGLAGMGTWYIVVHGVRFDDDGNEVGLDFTGDTYTKDVWYHSTMHVKTHGTDREHEALDAFDNAWDDYQTYPTIRFDVDETGKMTSATEW